MLAPTQIRTSAAENRTLTRLYRMPMVLEPLQYLALCIYHRAAFCAARLGDWTSMIRILEGEVSTTLRCASLQLEGFAQAFVAFGADVPPALLRLR